MFKIIALACLVAVACATFSVNLEAQNISEELFSITDKSETDKTKISVPLAPESAGKNLDTVYTTTAKIDGKDVQVAFDTTTGHNWQFLTQKEPVSAGPIDTNNAANGRAVLQKLDDSVQKVELNKDEQHLKKVTFQQSNQVSSTSNQGLFNAVQRGFSLNRRHDENFLNSLKKNEIKNESPNSFSFYYSKHVNKAYFGQSQVFFSESKLESLDAKSSDNDERWVLAVVDDSISFKGLDVLEQQKNTRAIFDTTTKYTWMDSNLLTSIVNRLVDNNCHDIGQGTTDVGIYDCDAKGKFPELEIKFKTIDAKDGKESRAYKLKNYTEEVISTDGTKKQRLLFRSAALYKKSTDVTEKVPSLSNNDKTLLILGTNFLQNVYVWFSAQDHTVHLGQSIGLVTQEKHMDNTARTWALIIGSIGMVATVAAIMSLLQKVPYKPQAVASLPAVKKAAPVVVLQSRVQPQMQQTRVLNSLPPQYQQQNFSPSRVLQGSRVPGSYQQF